jgi:hypothetical protein
MSQDGGNLATSAGSNGDAAARASEIPSAPEVTPSSSGESLARAKFEKVADAIESEGREFGRDEGSNGRDSRTNGAPPDPWTPEVLREAGLRGYDAAKAKQLFKNPEAMAAAFAYNDDMIYQAGQQYLAGQQQQYGQPGGAHPGQNPQGGPAANAFGFQGAPPPPTANPQQGGQQPTFEQLKQILSTPFALPPDHGFDEPTAKHLTAISQHAQQQVHALGRMVMTWVNTLQQAHDSSVGQRDFEQFDGWVAGLGDDWKPVFGSEHYSDLVPNSVESQARAKLLDAVETMRAGYIARQLTPPPTKQLWKSALRQAFGDHATKIAETKASKKVSDRLRNSAGQFSRAPEPRLAGGDNPNPIERARSRFNETADRVGLQ